MKMLQYDLNVSKNDYYFTQEKCKSSIFHYYMCRRLKGGGMEDYYEDE